MNVFNVIRVINVLYVVGIVVVAIFSNFVQAYPESNIMNGLIVVLAVLFISIPNILAANAVPPRLKLAKTTIALNLACIILFAVGLVAHKQEALAIYWAATVISISTMNVTVLVSGLLVSETLNQKLMQ